MNVLSIAKSDTYILQIIIQEELQKLARISHCKEILSQNKNLSAFGFGCGFSAFGYGNEEIYPVYVSKKC